MEAKNWLKIGAIFFFIGLILIFISWIFAYPIYISEINEITFTQFYPVLWPGIVISLLALFIILYYSKNKIIGALCCSIFPLFLYIPAFFFSYVPSSDCGASRGMFQVFQKTGIDPKVISYFEYPNYFSLNEIIHQIVGLDDKGAALISFILYGFLLGLFLYLFFVKLKNQRYNQLPFLLVIIYFVGMYSLLNYQWVPQTLALVYFFILIFISIYLLSDSSEIQWKFMIILIFIPLTLTHAFIQVIFLAFFGILTLKKRYLLQIFLVILSIYLSITIFYTMTHLHLFIETFLQSITSIGKEYAAYVSVSFGESESILSQLISFANRINIPAIWILGLIGTAVLFFKRKIEYVLIALGLAGGVYLAVGIFYSVLGLRAAQILLIPIAIGFMFFISKWKKPTMILVVIILILAVFGPMRMAYNNTQFQTDEEANGCNFLAKNIINETNPKVAIDQVNWGYFTNKYGYLKNENAEYFAIRPGSKGFLNLFNGSLNQNYYILYNSNLGKEILIYRMNKSQLINTLEEVLKNNKIYDCGTTFIINGINIHS